MRTSNFGQTNALTDLDEVVVPLVVNKRKDKDGTLTYHGFVPGIMVEDVVDTDLETVKSALDTKFKKVIGNMINNNIPFPFFPDKDQIIKDYKDVVFIKLLKIK